MVKIGRYKHYKGNFYYVVGEGYHSETQEALVIYRALYESEYGKDTLWVRPKAMFEEKVNVDGTTVDRFLYVGDE